MSIRLVSHLAIAAVVAALAVPATAVAVTPVDQSGTSAPSAPKVNPPSPSNEATSGSSMQGPAGSTAPAGTTRIESPEQTGTTTAAPAGSPSGQAGSDARTLSQPQPQSGGGSK
jgi:hypothetical protein